jgi:mycothiol system anti-sigma-R factor
MPCEYSHEQLYLYLDRELTPEEAQAVERHLQECASCQQEVAAHRRLQAMIRAALEEEEVPVQLWPAIRQRLAQEEVPIRPETRRSTRWRAWLGAGALAALLLLAWLGRSWLTAPLPTVVQEMVDSHIRTRLMVAPYTQVPGHPEAIQAWFRGRVEFAVPVPNLPQAHYRFQGVRVNYFLNRRVAELAYTTGTHPLSFFILAEPSLTLTAPHTVRGGKRTFYVQQRKGYTAILWKDGDMVCGLVSDLKAAKLVSLLQQSMPGASAS